MSEQNTFRDLSFDLNRSAYYKLLLQIDSNSFSYAITYEKELVALGTDYGLSELSDPQDLAEELAVNYKEIIIGIKGNGFTLVPAPLFSEDQIANYALLLDVKANEKVFAKRLDEKNFIIYKVDEKRVAAVQHFGLDKIVYSGKGLITAIAQASPLNNQLYLYAENGKVEFLYFKDNSIRFYNSFEFTDENDIAYFAAFVSEELGLSPNQVNLKLSGSVASEEKYSILLSKFFESVSLFDPQILELPGHIDSKQILNLAALTLCGSLEVH